jgi:hypothetical protein
VFEPLARRKSQHGAATDYPGASGTEDLIERGGEAGVPVMQDELHPHPGILQVREQVPACWTTHAWTRAVPEDCLACELR